MLGYELSTETEADLREVIRHTRRNWGNDQVETYVGQLTRCIERLVAGEGAFRRLDEIHADLRMVHCAHHYIFCLMCGAAPALVIAILHERMDLMRRLRGRL